MGWWGAWGVMGCVELKFTQLSGETWPSNPLSQREGKSSHPPPPYASLALSPSQQHLDAQRRPPPSSEPRHCRSIDINHATVGPTFAHYSQTPLLRLGRPTDLARLPSTHPSCSFPRVVAHNEQII